MLFGGVPAGWQTLTGIHSPILSGPVFIVPLTSSVRGPSAGFATMPESIGFIANRSARTGRGAGSRRRYHAGRLSWFLVAQHESRRRAQPDSRRGGRFFWRQVEQAVGAGDTMLYNAMFDEVDEGTAMFKLASTANEVPAAASIVTLDADGEILPSDWYLQLAREAQQRLRRVGGRGVGVGGGRDY